MYIIIPILFGCIIIVFHRQLANYYRSFGREKSSPVRWKYMEETIILAGIILILKALFSFF